MKKIIAILILAVFVAGCVDQSSNDYDNTNSGGDGGTTTTTEEVVETSTTSTTTSTTTTSTTTTTMVNIPVTTTTQPAPANGTVVRHFNWTDFNGNDWTWDLTLSEDTYNFYKSKKRTDEYTTYATDPYDDELIRTIVELFKQSASGEGYNDRDTINFVISFVQSLPYTSDNVTTGFDEYQRYPYETLWDNGGDCEDTAILTSVLLKEMGYDVVMISPPRHMAVGVNLESQSGTYYEFKGKKYYYLETTGDNWKIGEIPKEYKDQKVEVLPLIAKPYLTFEWTAKSVSYDSKKVNYLITVNVSNEGSETALNTKVYVAFETSDPNKVYSQKYSAPLDIESAGSGWYKISLDVPRKVDTRLVVTMVSDNAAPPTQHSTWFKT
ncbi:MAG: hypothetical protein HY362_03400 [Candidatus Aenigmarchaeota archaeon]|nr:hypothetical protein [Candidatus Aenigmarchaeota archaeon]